MLSFKKFGLFFVGMLVFFGFNFMYTSSISVRDHYNNIWSPGETRYSTPIVDGMEINDNSISSGSKIMGEKSSGILHLPEPQDYETKLSYFLTLIQIIVNWIITMLSFVAVVFILYNGFLILSAGHNDKDTSKGKNGIKTAIIALAGIAISRLIISIMIRLISGLSGA